MKDKDFLEKLEKEMVGDVIGRIKEAMELAENLLASIPEKDQEVGQEVIEREFKAVLTGPLLILKNNLQLLKDKFEEMS